MSSQKSFADPSEATEAVAGYLERTRDTAERIHPGSARTCGRPRAAAGAGTGTRRLIEGSSDLLDRRRVETERGFTRTLERLPIPAMLVWGGLSDIVTPEIAAEFASLNPRAEAVEVPRTGHMIAGDSNDPFTAAVLDFLGEADPSGEACAQSNSD